MTSTNTPLRPLRIGRRGKQIDALHAYCDRIEAENARHVADLDSARAGNETLAGDVARLEEAARKDGDEFRELRANLASRDRTLAEARETIKDLGGDYAERGRLLDEARAELQALREVEIERDQLRATVADLEGQLAIARQLATIPHSEAVGGTPAEPFGTESDPGSADPPAPGDPPAGPLPRRRSSRSRNT